MADVRAADRLSLSIIVPVYNEAANMHDLQQNLLPLADACDIIFVDGGSTDGTPEAVDPAFRLVRSEKGRGVQLNAGARVATGNVLLFLHADSRLPPNALAEVRRVMRTHRVGCFGIAFESNAPALLMCRVWSNARAKYRHIIFGDQGIFIDRALFWEIGGFPALPLMEDYQLSLTLRARGQCPGMARSRIRTSARRFPAGAVAQIRVMCQMAHLRKLYRQGVDPAELARRYRDVR